MRFRPLPLVLLLAAAPLAAAPNAGKVLRCDADSSLTCTGAQCKRVPDEYAHVELFLSPSEKGGSLCTFTYCRDFDWLPVMGDKSKRRTFGPIRSDSSGSTDDRFGIPVVDYHLWISENRGRFALLPLDSSGATWTGGCTYQD